MSSIVDDSDDVMYYWVNSPVKTRPNLSESRKKRKFEEEKVDYQVQRRKKSKKSHEINEDSSKDKISSRKSKKLSSETLVKPRKPRTLAKKTTVVLKSRNSKQKISKITEDKPTGKILKSAEQNNKKLESKRAMESPPKKKNVQKTKPTPTAKPRQNSQQSKRVLSAKEDQNSLMVGKTKKVVVEVAKPTTASSLAAAAPLKTDPKDKSRKPKSSKEEKKQKNPSNPKHVSKNENTDSQIKKPRKKKAPATAATGESSQNGKVEENEQSGLKQESLPTEATTSETVKEIIQYKHAYEDPNWLGNEDENGSVASGVLEEDFCVECGQSTLSNLETNDVILCDICDGEYHLKCLGFDRVPRATFVCKKCLDEQDQQRTLKFNVSDTFKIPRQRVTDRRVIYTPARPLDAAWAECKAKGLMTVSNVFSYEIMKYLTHGTIENKTASGRVIDTWRGATYEIVSRLNSNCHNLVDREGRYDLKIPQFVIEQLKLNEILEPIFERLRTIMGSNPPPKVRTHDIVFVPVGSKCQKWHTDDDFSKKKATKHRYFTVLIQLNSIDSNCGGTEVWVDKMNRGDLIRCRPGDALVFNGQLLHRGQANQGYSHRFFYYCSFSCDADMNDASME